MSSTSSPMRARRPPYKVAGCVSALGHAHSRGRAKGPEPATDACPKDPPFVPTGLFPTYVPAGTISSSVGASDLEGHPRDPCPQAFGWLPPKADAKSLAEYASKQGADTVLVSAEDKDLVDGLQSLSDPPVQLEVVPAGK
jgi:hypothetical protein